MTHKSKKVEEVYRCVQAVQVCTGHCTSGDQCHVCCVTSLWGWRGGWGRAQINKKIPSLMGGTLRYML